MKVFDLYSAYYDLLYRDKDYLAESQYVLDQLGSGSGEGLRILELGCGTGGHALELARTGCRVHGIDLSQGMVDRAIARAQASAMEGQLAFERGDALDFRCGRPFDAVVSLFHVMSYQTSNDDLRSAVATARTHLVPGGAFIFDFWYGPAVLTDRPKLQTKQVCDDTIDVVRQATPTMRVNQNCVDVRFDIDIRASATGERRQVTEHHRMRYLFLPEIEQFLALEGFELETASAWMSDRQLDDRSWYGCVVARAQR
jgi:SAM-dependent methyltransferase